MGTNYYIKTIKQCPSCGIPQYDEYHIYPVDKHSLRTVQAIKDFGTETGAKKFPFVCVMF